MKRKIFLLSLLSFAIFLIFIIDTKNKVYIPSIIESCQDLIKEELKAPGTFSLISASAYVANNTPTLAIEYEAKNSFGVPLRDTCFFSFALSDAFLPGLPSDEIFFAEFESPDLDLNDVVCSNGMTFKKIKGHFLHWKNMLRYAFKEEKKMIRLGYKIQYKYDVSSWKKDILFDGKMQQFGKKHFLNSPMETFREYTLWEKIQIRVKKLF